MYESYVTRDEQKAQWRMAQMEQAGMAATRGFTYMREGLEGMGRGAEEFKETLMGGHGADLESYEKWRKRNQETARRRQEREGTLGTQLLGFASQYMPGIPSKSASKYMEISAEEQERIRREDIARYRAKRGLEPIEYRTEEGRRGEEEKQTKVARKIEKKMVGGEEIEVENKVITTITKKGDINRRVAERS
jgi:hypothetical protein